MTHLKNDNMVKEWHTQTASDIAHYCSTNRPWCLPEIAQLIANSEPTPPAPTEMPEEVEEAIAGLQYAVNTKLFPNEQTDRSISTLINALRQMQASQKAQAGEIEGQKRMFNQQQAFYEHLSDQSLARIDRLQSSNESLQRQVEEQARILDWVDAHATFPNVKLRDEYAACRRSQPDKPGKEGEK